MGRLGMMQGSWSGNWPQNMMNWGSGFSVWPGSWMWLAFLPVVIWLIVGILATLWLWKKIQEK